MSEKGKQSEAAQAAQPSGQIAELTSRLMQRHALPAGVINTRHPQQLHARTAGWVAQRFAWLDHWRTRYAGGENSMATGGGLTLRSPSLSALREQPVPASDTPYISRAAPAPLAALKPPMQAPAVTASPMLRVSRRPASPAKTAQSPSAPGGVSDAASPAVSEKGEGEPDEASDGAAGKSSSGLRTGTLAAPADGNSTPMVLAKGGGEAVALPAGTPARTLINAAEPIMIAASELRVSRSVARSPEIAPSPPAPSGYSQSASPVVSAADGVARVSRSEPISEAPSAARGAALPMAVAVQRKADGASPNFPDMTWNIAADDVARVSRSEPISEAPSAARGAASPMAVAVQRKADDVSPILRKGKVIGTPAVESGKLPATTQPALPIQMARKARPGAGQVMPPPAAAPPLPLAEAIVQRKAAVAAINDGENRSSQGQVQDSSAVAVSRMAAERMAGANPVVKAEIPALTVAAPPPKMVWRKSANDSSTALPLIQREHITPSARMIARQDDTMSNSASSSTGETSVRESLSSSSGNDVDVEWIAERVSQMLARQLAVERERRGR